MTQIPFGLKNYWRMYKARGLLYPLSYFFQIRLFDIRRRVDTHLWIPKEFEPSSLFRSSHGFIYMASRTIDIKKSFSTAHQVLGNEFESFDFLDIGSGKGKVILVWHLLCKKSGCIQNIQGIEHSQILVDIAKANFVSMFKYHSNEIFTYGDFTNFDFGKLSDKLIIFLFNPFDDVLILKLIEKIKSKKVFVIYSAANYAKVFIENNFLEVKKNKNRWLGSEFDVSFLANFEM